MAKRMLILGGTGFIGRAFCGRVVEREPFDVCMLNRGLTCPDLFAETPRLRCDRYDASQCANALQGSHWDYIVDFSGLHPVHIENVLASCSFDHYTFVSSSAVELASPQDPLFKMAQDKLWCEHKLMSTQGEVLIVRPGYVVGADDGSQRFEMLDGCWFWRGTMEAVQPQVHVELLVNLMLELVSRNYTGLVRAGYTAPQPDFLRRRDFSATQAGQDGLSQLEDSVGLLRLSIREQPADAKAWFHLGQTLAQLQQHEGAITAFDRCTALRAQNEQAAWSAYMSAKSLAHLGLWEEAIERCVVGMAADAHTPELAWMCSWCYYQIEDFRQAIVWSRIAIALGCVDGMGDIRNRGEYRDWIAWYDGPYDILSHALKQVGDESGSQAAWSRRLWASQQRESVFATM